MKCRACWSDKAYVRTETGLKSAVLSCMGFVPLKCQHCFHKFWVPFFSTWGKVLHPPKLAMPGEKPVKSGHESAPQRRKAA